MYKGIKLCHILHFEAKLDLKNIVNFQKNLFTTLVLSKRSNYWTLKDNYKSCKNNLLTEGLINYYFMGLS